RFVLRTKPHLVAIRPLQRALGLETLYFGDEVRKAEDVARLPAVTLSERELKTAQQLIGAMAAEWIPDKHADEYREELVQLLSAMAAATSAPNGAAPWERTSSVAFTRPSTRSGTAVCTTVSCAIHWIVFVPSPMSCGRNTMSVARNSGPDASGVRTPMAELAS